MGEREIFGAWGEERAAEYLRRKRVLVVGRNYRRRGGELDLIAETKEYLLFVEVKTRRSAAFSEAREAVDLRKQARLRLAAACWLAEFPSEKQPRFDVIEVYAPEGVATRNPEIRHWEDAFQ